MPWKGCGQKRALLKLSLAWVICCCLSGSVYNRSLDNDQVTLLFDEVVPQPPEDLPVLELEFSYVMQEGLDGFYRSTYHCKFGLLNCSGTSNGNDGAGQPFLLHRCHHAWRLVAVVRPVLLLLCQPVARHDSVH